MMKIHGFVLVVTSLAVGAFAQASPPPKYRVTEVAAPSAADNCLPGYAISMTGGGVSDRGTVPGNILCYGKADMGNGVVLPSKSVNTAFVWNRFAGAMEVAPPPDSATPTLFDIDSAGTVYGWMGDQTGLNGVRWTPWAGFETVITKSPDCFLNVSFAIAGNAAGNVVGAAYRQDGVSQFPTEWTCAFRWVFRDALGTEIVGPQQSQTPTRMNQHNVVVGQVNQSAVKWLPLRGNALITLDQASPGFMSYALGINKRDVVVGVAGVDTANGACWSDAVGMLWGRDNESRSLPSLPPLTNSEAWSIDDEGTVYGLSSMGADSCAKRSWEGNRGTIWRKFRTYDLNKLLIGPPTVTITKAAHVNEKGQILAYGFRTRDALKDCPHVGASPDDGAPILIPQKCRDQRLYLLTPL